MKFFLVISASLLALLAACGSASESETRALVHYQGLRCGQTLIYKLECRDSKSLASNRATEVLQSGNYIQCSNSERALTTVHEGSGDTNATCEVGGKTYHYDAAKHSVSVDGGDTVACEPFEKSDDYGATGTTCSDWEYIIQHPRI